MCSQAITLTFLDITEADLPDLTAAMTRAFDDDSQRHLGVPRGGPPGYDNGEFFREWLFRQEHTRGRKIVANGKTVGAYIVWIFEHGRNVLGTIFVDPAWQNRGVARRAWAFIEAEYPETRSWTLDTPVWATRNHYFYEKVCGFRKVETRGESVIYRKEMGSGS